MTDPYLRAIPLMLLALSSWVGAQGAAGPAGSLSATIRAVEPGAVESKSIEPTLCALSDPTCVPPRVSREFRGVWVAAVGNIDWPSRPGLPVDSAQRELLALLDRARASGMNAVILQVRPAGDALYSSALEPWSEYLTGKQGVAPNPWWDPLKFAVDQAHRRGLELHAWFNPYRAKLPSAKSPLAKGHIANKQPALVKTYGKHLWMDPGEPAVREHTLQVIIDVVKRYDIDGVHIDDYFYPYKERDSRGPIEFPDSESYARFRFGGGVLSRDDWRRQNVDELVEALYTRIHEEKPWVKFGVSPFGIWRPGFPTQITGFDAYTELYADARKWLREGWVDYFSPQLYWPVTQVGQSYPVLLRWWAEQNSFGRHLWPGNYASKVSASGRTAWRTSEILDQIAATRAEAGASGNIHFSAKVFMENRDSLATRIFRQVYNEPALVPSSPWMAVAVQGEPQVALKPGARGTMTATLTPSGEEPPRWWLVQTRISSGVWSSALLRGSVREISIAAAADRVAVRALDRAAVEGPMQVIRVRD